MAALSVGIVPLETKSYRVPFFSSFPFFAEVNVAVVPLVEGMLSSYSKRFCLESLTFISSLVKMTV